MTRQDDIFNKEELPQTTNEEPRIENEYAPHPEIEQPSPDTATPSIPAEIPTR
ncbi:MAG TPA: hypothetical protein GXX75_10285 [Clostridiales bacterium]|nr:hypothetical protein [Clostridiales bacterium]